MKRMELNRWQLRGYFNCDPLYARSRETNAMTRGVTFDMDITTPHDLYADLQRYGYIDDPYFGRNSVKCEWVANRWWLYYAEVTLDALPQHMELVCEGIDGNALIFINENEVGRTDNAFIGWCFDAAPYMKTGKNEIKIIVENAPNEYGQIGYSTKLTTQKPKFNYKWDFCTRLISLGINKPVYLRLFDDARIEDVYFDAHNDITGHADVITEIFGDAADCTVEVEFDSKLYCAPAGKKISIYAENVRPWYPNGYGEAALYSLQVRLFRDGAELDRREMKVGFRRAEFLRNEGAAVNSHPYTYRVNGRKVYLKGV
ncbi:MAG: hypothetical protein J6I98_06555, partial [Clostridia bacterium]|nr:hypothetical protein [Clostridia bacterium]